MARRTGCVTQVLAADPICRIERCSHGTLHLTLGSLTLRLSPVQVSRLSEALARAAERIEAPDLERGSRLLC